MNAPGWPGIAPTWASSAKDMVGTALGAGRVWYTLGFGILNEVYWPACSTPQIRDLGFIVAGNGFWTEVKRENRYRLSTPAPDLPLPKVVHRHPRYRLELEVLADPWRDVLLIRYRLENRSPAGGDLKLYALLAPHLQGSGHGNSARVLPRGLAAVGGDSALMLAADHGFSRASAGYVGDSDGWQDFHRHGAMTWEYSQAVDGNVALLGELTAAEGVLALGFAGTVEGAQTLALSSLVKGFEGARTAFVDGWRQWARPLRCADMTPEVEQAVRRAATVLKIHGDRAFPGALVASLSVPWGDTRDDPGGYHLVWPRDAVEAGFAMLACEHRAEARSMLAYLAATQQADGHWAQNFFADGRPYWTGIQLDETALPVLLAAKLDQLDALGDMRHAAIAMVRCALRFIARHGPLSPQDRWEENPGISPFTLAACIAALVAGAEHGFLDPADAAHALSLADDWNARVESWVYVRDTALDREHGTAGHYVRIAPPGHNAQSGDVAVRNRGRMCLSAENLLGLEYLYLVRLGLRAADDPRIRDTTRLVDALLRVETPHGAYYHRYNEDGYGERADGRAFDGTGIGRAWPLLCGERGQQALLAGEDAKPYLDAMLASASPGGMLPEQVWDSAPIAERRLLPGRPTGSAMPLVWAHAELIKLATAMHCGQPIECLPAVADRYRKPRPPAATHWREQAPCNAVSRNGTLLVEAQAPFVLHLGVDGWQRIGDHDSRPTGFGLYGVRLDVARLGAQHTLEFTRRYIDESAGERGWEGRDWQVPLLPLDQHGNPAA
ncbi:MAG: glucan 1,4-alpha-glucosidase [Gammaproteobacteria bacterium]|nr:glucan 1,4-alpha-glucosidase [Gammaproteobacteria bacterium]